jgi:hypothetical protein
MIHIKRNPGSTIGINLNGLLPQRYLINEVLLLAEINFVPLPGRNMPGKNAGVNLIRLR